MANRLLRALMIGGCACGTTAAEPSGTTTRLASGITVHQGLAYSRVGAGLTLDLYLPKPPGNAFPCVVVIQGGGFRAQNGRRFRPFAAQFAENGFAAALIAYRGTPGHTYQDTIADVQAAVRYVRQHAVSHGIDPDRIGAMGRSAGATLAALLAVLDEPRDSPECSARIQAAVGLAGVYDFVARFTDREQAAMQPRFETKIKSNGEWIGEPFSATGEHWRNASAVNHIDRADPPMLLMHCKDDSTVPWQQSQIMYSELREAGIEAEIELYDRGGHGLRTGDPAAPMKRTVAFFRKTLGKRSATGDAQRGVRGTQPQSEQSRADDTN